MLLVFCYKHFWPVGRSVTHLSLERKVWYLNRTQCSQRLATAAAFLREDLRCPEAQWCGFEPQTSRSRDKRVTARPTGRYENLRHDKLWISKKKKLVKAVSYSINAANCNALTLMQYVHCLRNIHNWGTTVCRQIVYVEHFYENIIYHYPHIFFCKSPVRNLVWNWLEWEYGRFSSIPFLKSSMPFHSGIFHIPYRNFRSIPYHALRRTFRRMISQWQHDVGFFRSEIWISDLSLYTRTCYLWTKWLVKSEWWYFLRIVFGRPQQKWSSA